MKRQSQNQRLLAHLESEGSITPGEALLVHGIFRLAARINDLRDAGHDIETVMHVDRAGKRYARYWLQGVAA